MNHTRPNHKRRLLAAPPVIAALCSVAFTGTGPSAVEFAWTVDGDQAYAVLGKSVAGAGDVNGDGFDDVIVGAIGFDHDLPDEGRVSLYLGSQLGPAKTPVWTAEGGQEDAEFGISVAIAGDVNGDGFDDVIVGAHQFSNGNTLEGAAFLYLGTASGLLLGPAWSAEGDQPLAGFGLSVAGAGDVNDDGFDDVIVGAPRGVRTQADEGIAYLYLGTASGLPSVPDRVLAGGVPGANFGTSVAGAGDVNGDGFDDVIVGAPRYDNGQDAFGRVFVYLGEASGVSIAPSWFAEGLALFGMSVDGAGDVDGDGFGDVLVGEPTLSSGEFLEGRATLYRGSANGPLSTPAWTVEGDQTQAWFGIGVAGAGDVNGDGFGDVIVGAKGFSRGEPGEGHVFVFAGSATGLSTAPTWIAASNQAGAQFGTSVASAGDVNGDGLDEVIAGSHVFRDEHVAEGRAFLYNLGPAFTLGTAYCAAAVNSSDRPASIIALGSEVAAEQDLILETEGCPAGVTGLYYYGTSSVSVPFGDGFRCAGGAITRIEPTVQTDTTGTARRTIRFSAPYAGAIVAGADLRFQLWFRDTAAGMSGFNLSNGLRITFQ